MLLGCSNEVKHAKQSHSSTNKITSDYLLSCGFKQCVDDPDTYEIKHMHLADMAYKMDFSLVALRPTLNQSRSEDIRTVKIKSLAFVVESEERDRDGKIVPDSLDNPDAICTISVSLRQVSTPEYLAFDSDPSLHIKTATVQQNGSLSIHISFEFSASGLTPLAVSRTQLTVSLSGNNTYYRSRNVSFDTGTPEMIVVKPGEPLEITITASDFFDEIKQSNDLPAGQYALSIGIYPDGKEQHFDYQWQGETHSDDYKFDISKTKE
jgi:hypothetical protein